jgi:hypothetical protein
MGMLLLTKGTRLAGISLLTPPNGSAMHNTFPAGLDKFEHTSILPDLVPRYEYDYNLNRAKGQMVSAPQIFSLPSTSSARNSNNSAEDEVGARRALKESHGAIPGQQNKSDTKRKQAPWCSQSQ